MRRFIVETVIDAVIILVIVLFLGLFEVAQPFPFGLETAPILQFTGAGAIPLLVTAAILVLSQRFVRPVIVAFTGRLLLSTMGLFLIIVNAPSSGRPRSSPWTSRRSPSGVGVALVFAAVYTLGGVAMPCSA